MEHEESSIDSTAVDPAAVAAAAAMSDLSDEPSPAFPGQLQIRGLVHLCAPVSLMLYDAHGVSAHCCVGAPLAFICAAPRVDSAGEPACELCGRRLRTVKGKLHLHPPGKICHSCYMKAQRPSAAAVDSSSAQPAAPVRSHKRKAESDPGEQQTQQQQSRMQTITRRILPLPPTKHALPRSMRSTERIARQLEETTHRE